MNQIKSKFLSRLLAALLSAVLVFSMLPLSALPALAAPEDDPDHGVVIYVTNSAGTPLSGASVSYKVYTTANDLVEQTENTDADGCLEIMTQAQYNSLWEEYGAMKLDAQVSKTDYDYAEGYGDLSDEAVTAKDQVFDFVLQRSSLPDVEITPVGGLVYNGAAQTLLTVSCPETDTVSYKVDGVEAEKPEAVEAGPHSVNVSVSRSGYDEALEKSYTVTIAPAELELELQAVSGLTDTGSPQNLVTLTGTLAANDAVEWTVDGVETTAGPDGVPMGTDVGSYEVSVKVTRCDAENHPDPNYKVFESTVTAEIAEKQLDLGDLTITPNELTYNGEAQQALTVKDQGDYDLEYRFSEADPWVTMSATQYPQVTDHGSYSVYVRAVKDGLTKDCPGSPYTVTVAQAALELNLSANTLNYTGEPQDLVTLTGDLKTGDKVVWTVDGEETAAGPNGVPQGTEKKVYTVGVTVTRCDAEGHPDENWLPFTASVSVTMAGPLVDWSEITITFYDMPFTYNGNKHYLVNNIDKPDDVTLEYRMSYSGEDSWAVLGKNKPYFKDAGEFKVYIRAKKEGCEPTPYSVYPLTVIVQRAELGVSITAKEGLVYNENLQDLVTLAGFEKLRATDEITWYVDGAETAVARGSVPQAKDPGTYKVRLVVTRPEAGKDNYADYDSGEIEVTIGNAPVTLGDLSVSGLELVYSGAAQAALEVRKPADCAYELWYRFEGDTEWLPLNDSSYPTVTDPGSYRFEIKATQEGYTEVLYPETPETTVSKAPQALTFTAGAELITLDPESSTTEQYTADGDNLSGAAVVYELVDLSASDVASIDPATGLLTAGKPGVCTVKATRAGNAYYEEAVAYQTVTVMMPAEGLISFAADSVDYRLNNAGDLVSEQTAQKKYADDNGTISYSIDQTDLGLAIDKDTGKITVTDRNVLTQKLGVDGELSLTVTASKTVGTVEETRWEITGWVLLLPIFSSHTEVFEIYPAAETSYTLKIRYTDLADFDAVWTISSPDANTGWYNLDNLAYISDAKSKPQENPEDPEHPIVKNYLVATDPNGPFDVDLTITKQGTEGHYLYLQDSDGYVSPGILLDIKVDTVAPDAKNMSIAYSEPHLKETVLSTILLGFYSESVDVTFRASDETSGVASLNWSYARASDASTANLASDSGVLAFGADGKAVLTISGDAARQYRGNLSFTATDAAGNVSDVKTDAQNVIVVDTISPDCTISYADVVRTVSADGKEQRFFAGDIVLTVRVTENNFYKEDFKLTVAKNGGKPTTVTPAWKAVDGKDNQFIGSYTISGDGHYVVGAAYTDKSTNPGVMHDGGKTATASYTSTELVIDTVTPTLTLNFDKDPAKQELQLQITEHNFLPADIETTVTATDINGKSVAVNDLTAELRSAKWKRSGDSYSYSTAKLNDGLYQITVSYKDPAGHPVSKSLSFTVDHQAPTIPEISYSVPVTETVLASLTMGFYNPQVTVTFTAYDTVSGVDHFTWSYQRQKGASETNVAAYEQASVKAAADSSNKSKFTASVTMPLEKAQQIRGSVAVSATDKYNHTSNKRSDTNHVLVVDTVSPKLRVSYSAADNTVGSTRYYGAAQKGQVQVTLELTEANFFPEDVKVTLQKQGAADAAISPQWKDLSTDSHVGQFTVSGDGHYVIRVDYTDRSGNKMTSYASDLITIDTVKPVIEVSYQNHNAVNTLTDREGHTRSYFNAEQTAIVTVTEHNFNANDVKFSIVGKDVTGAERAIDGLVTKSGWSGESDVHRMTIRYPGNANFTFDVDYTDLAKNQAADYSPDYFTVDTAAPTVTGVNYSASVKDTVLSNVTFGFYNSKVTVTITANDDVSGVHRIDYSYLNAAGVSGVNAQLLDQAIDEARINYSNGGRTATISFDVPREALGPNNQFNGSIRFDAVDRSNNRVDQAENRRLVVDNISPSCSVSFNSPVNTADGVDYFDGSITGSIRLTEANFYEEDAAVRSSKDGGAPAALTTSWADEDVNTHDGRFTISEDGEYTVLFSYRDKSGNAMEDYTSGKMIVDTVIEAPAVTVNGTPASGDAGAFQDAVEVACSFRDQNFDTVSAELKRQRFNEAEDLTAQFISFTLDETGGSGSFRIPEEVENDGIYTMKVTMTDKAGHSAETAVRFIVNRFGSVYSYSDYLCSLIKDGGQHVSASDGKSAVREDLVITEYNADKLEDGSLNILITCNGEPVEASFDSKPGSSDKWNEYVYTIHKETFQSDGLYKISISSNDRTGNPSSSVPENSFAPDGSQILDQMMFTVDTTAPEIRNITNLENEIADRDAIVDGKLNVKYKIMDTGGLASVEVYLNDQLVDRIVDFGDGDGYDGSFDIGESNDVQKVRILVTDLAGNVTDTASESFDPGELYEFHDQVTVSTNLFVRWYRNAPAFWGSIGGAGVAAAGGFFLLGKKKKKAAPEDAKSEKKPEKKSK